MAISGSATQSFDMVVVNGKLQLGRYALRQSVEMDVEQAVKDLLRGRVVFVHAYGDKCKTVRLAVEAALEAKDDTDDNATR